MAIETLLASLARLAATAADRQALEDGTLSLTLGQSVRAISGGARWLRSRSVRPGDRVLLHGPNSVSIALAYFAVHAARAVAVPVGPDQSATTLARILDECRPSLVLAAEPARFPDANVCSLPTADQWLLEAGSSFAECLLEDPADLLFTTGTTGRSKGVLLSHANIASAADNINTFVGTRADDVEAVPVPLSHSFGLGRLRCWAQKGHRLVLEPSLRNPALLFKRLVEVRATGLATVPAGVALLRQLIRQRFADIAPHLRYIELGSAALPAQDREWLLEMLPGTRICHHYGLTEASRAVFKDLRADAHKPDSIGRASPNVEVMIADDDGRPVPGGQSGEILVRGGMLMREYWHQPELTAGVLRDGWLRTADEGWVDADGYLYLRGRKDDIVNVGGLKVSPLDVERLLCGLEGIREAACVGVPDPRGILGQVVKAFVVSDHEPDAPAIIKALRLHLAEHEIPRLFERVGSLPKTESGKIRRAELRATKVH